MSHAVRQTCECSLACNFGGGCIFFEFVVPCDVWLLDVLLFEVLLVVSRGSFHLSQAVHFDERKKVRKRN